MELRTNTAFAYTEKGIGQNYLIYLSRIERLHRLLLDVIKDDFERLKISELNAVQALLLYNISDQEITAGELRTRGYYQGSNVSYNLKKLIEAGYIDHKRSALDRRSIKIKLTERGHQIHTLIHNLFDKHIDEIEQKSLVSVDEFKKINEIAVRIERFWSGQIRYIY